MRRRRRPLLRSRHNHHMLHGGKNRHTEIKSFCSTMMGPGLEHRFTWLKSPAFSCYPTPPLAEMPFSLNLTEHNNGTSHVLLPHSSHTCSFWPTRVRTSRASTPLCILQWPLQSQPQTRPCDLFIYCRTNDHPESWSFFLPN